MSVYKEYDSLRIKFNRWECTMDDLAKAYKQLTSIYH